MRKKTIFTKKSDELNSMMLELLFLLLKTFRWSPINSFTFRMKYHSWSLLWLVVGMSRLGLPT